MISGTMKEQLISDQGSLELQKWQNDFLESIIKSKTCMVDFLPAGQLTASEALKVYSDGYRARLTEALGQNFESVWGILGDELFFETCWDFIKQEKSDDYNINHYNIKFIDFVGSRFQSEFSFLRDLAAFDWFFQELFHQATQVGLSPSEMSEILQSREVTKVKLVPSVKVILSPFKLGQMSRLARKNEMIEFNLVKKESCTLLYKTAKGIEVLDLEVSIGRAIENLIKGQEISKALSDLDADQISRLFEVLASARLALSLQ